MTDDIEVLLFDLGGVLLHLNDTLDTFDVRMSDVDFRERWLLSDSTRQHESGRISFDEFAHGMLDELELPYDADEFARRFDAWPGEMYDQTLSLLDSLSNRYRLAVLSNVSARHWELPRIAQHIEPRVEHTFLSYKTGLLKPDAETYSDVVSTLGTSPERILFFDDNILNVKAARSQGLRAAHTIGGDQLIANLREANVL